MAVTVERMKIYVLGNFFLLLCLDAIIDNQKQTKLNTCLLMNLSSNYVEEWRLWAIYSVHRQEQWQSFFSEVKLLWLLSSCCWLQCFCAF
jgi:hypothetical protein